MKSIAKTPGLFLFIIFLFIVSCNSNTKNYSVMVKNGSVVIRMHCPTIGLVGINQVGYDGFTYEEVEKSIFDEIRNSSYNGDYTVSVILQYRDSYGNFSTEDTTVVCTLNGEDVKRYASYSYFNGKANIAKAYPWNRTEEKKVLSLENVNREGFQKKTPSFYRLDSIVGSTFVTSWTYNASDLVTECLMKYTRDGKKYRRTSYSYDDGGNRREYNYIYEDNQWKLQYISDDTFDTHNRKILGITSVMDNQKITLSGKVELSYDQYDNYNSIVHYKYDKSLQSWIPSRRYEYTNSISGRQQSSNEYEWSNGSWRQKEYDQYSYDRNGQLSTRISYSSKTNEITYKTEWEFDSGNLVSYKFYSNSSGNLSLSSSEKFTFRNDILMSKVIYPVGDVEVGTNYSKNRYALSSKSRSDATLGFSTSEKYYYSEIYR